MKFIVPVQVNVKFSMILPRKQMPVSILTKKPHHYCDSQSWNKMHPRFLGQSFSREDSKQLPLRVFSLWLMQMFREQRTPFLGRKAPGCSLSTRVSSSASPLEPQGTGRELSTVCCRLRSQIDR